MKRPFNLFNDELIDLYKYITNIKTDRNYF